MLTTTVKKPAKSGGFPKLMRYTGTEYGEEIIVLFSDYRVGTYLSGPTIGRHVDSLLMEYFEPFYGSVTVGVSF